jgi:hypothetical protein
MGVPMVLKKKPVMELPNPFVPSGGVRMYVGGSSPQWSWTSVAEELGLGDVWKDLIEFNFPSVAHEKSFNDKCKAVNWYLEERVGCTRTADGNNYSFEGANPGFIFVPAKRPGPKPRPKPPVANYSMLARFLLTDAESAKRIAPATIDPFPHRSEQYVRQRLAAAVRVARYAHVGLAALAAKDNKEKLWNEGLAAWWFGEYSERKLNKVLSTFSDIAQHLASDRLKVVCKSGKSSFGSALPAIPKITLGALWVSPGFATAQDDEAERVQTFVHEGAHISGRVIASEHKHYGRTLAHALVDAGMRATRSADNYGYYAIDFALQQ